MTQSNSPQCLRETERGGRVEVGTEGEVNWGKGNENRRQHR